jgi:hypothetical protein
MKVTKPQRKTRERERKTQIYKAEENKYKMARVSPYPVIIASRKEDQCADLTFIKYSFDLVILILRRKRCLFRKKYAKIRFSHLWTLFS